MFVGPSRPRTAAARALLAGTTLHPVVRLGWKPLCEVHCNGCVAAVGVAFPGPHSRRPYAEPSNEGPCTQLVCIRTMQLLRCWCTVG